MEENNKAMKKLKGNTSKFLSFILLFMLIHYGATTLKILPIKIKIDR